MPDSDGYIRDAKEASRIGVNYPIYQTIENAYRNHTTSVNISEYKIAWDIRDALTTYTHGVILNTDMFHNENTPGTSFVSSGSGNTKIVDRINFTYNTLLTNDQNWENTVITKAAAACASMPETANTAYGDVQRILQVHDWICGNCHYDQTLQKGTAYHGFVDHTTVCRGYTRMVNYMCKNQGIPSYIIGDNVHVWNMVYIDKRWYLVDTTWDAGYDANTGYLPAGYNNFLVGDIEFNESHVLDTTIHRCYSPSGVAPDFITNRFRLVDWSKITRSSSGAISNAPVNGLMGSYFWVKDTPTGYGSWTRLTRGNDGDGSNSDNYSNALLKSEYLDKNMQQIHWMNSVPQALRYNAKKDGISVDQTRLVGSEVANRLGVL